MKFLVEEIPTLGGSGIRATPERFEWDPANLSSPQGPMAYGGEQRFKRTDYPGSVGAPTIQILGPKLNAQTFRGLWSDRHNFPGYAKAEKRRFLAMCYRGNRVRIQVDDIDLLGVIVSWDFPYEKDWRIQYEFTVEIANDGIIGEAAIIRAPETTISPRQLADELELQAAPLYTAQELGDGTFSLEETRRDLSQSMEGDLNAGIGESLEGIGAAMDDVNGIIETRLSGIEDRSALTRLSQGFRSVRGAVLDTLDILAEVRADTSLQYRTAVSELSFETWSRSVRYQARLAGLSAFRAEQTTAERADPVAIATYRPLAGESLYDISMKCYGTPHYWRAIADRNRLETFILDGTEDLVIPEVPVGA